MAEQLGKYTVIRRLGAGGMAEVFLCKLVGIGGFEKHVVLKRIRADVAHDQEFITMFFDEARLAANLNHPNIIQTFEVDALDGVPYIAMEYVRGSTLAAILQKQRASKQRPEYGHYALIFAGICAGLEHAHEACDADGNPLDIVHRDISPQNIIVSSNGTPKVFDFGIAKAASSLALTGADRVKGKFAYMAPEQLRAQPVGPRADVFAVGVCLYEATTGHRPFAGATEAELFAARLSGRFRLPTSVAGPEYPVELEEIILDAMDPDPANRPSAPVLRDRLLAFAAAGPHASTTSALSAWAKSMASEDGDAYESFTTSPAMTPLSRRVSVNAMSSGLVPHGEQGRRSRKGLRVVAAAAALLVTGAAAAGVMYARHDSAPAAELALQAPVATVPAAAATLPAAAAAPSANAALRAYLDEAERNIAERQFNTAAEHLAKAAALETSDPSLDIRRTRLQHLIDTDRMRNQGREALASRDYQTALELGKALLAEDRDDPMAQQLVTEATRGARQAPGAATVAVAPRPAPARTLTVARVPQRPAPGRKPAPGSAGAGSGSGGAGSGSAAMSTGSAAPVEVAPAPVVDAGPGSAGPGSAGPGSAGPGSAPTPAVARPAAPVVERGSLDAMPSVSRVAVDGSLTTSEVQSAVGRTLDALRGCYRSAAQRANRTPDLTIKLQFEIDEGARAVRVRVAGDTLGLAACARDATSGVRTRVAPDVGTVAVTATIRFKPIAK